MDLQHPYFLASKKCQLYRNTQYPVNSTRVSYKHIKLKINNINAYTLNGYANERKGYGTFIMNVDPQITIILAFLCSILTLTWFSGGTYTKTPNLEGLF